MTREGQLVKNTAIISIGKICTQLITFLLLPVYTALLSTEEYGIVDLLNTFVSLLLPIVTLQMEQSLFRYLIDVRNDEKEKKNVISTAIISIVAQSIIYLVIFTLISRFIHNEYKFFLATNVVACIISSIMLQISRGLGDNTKYAIGSFISATSMILFNILFIIVFKMGAYGMLLANLLSNILCGVYIFAVKRIYKYIDIKVFDKKTLKKMWKYSIPLIPNALSWWVFNASDRVIVSWILNVSANGILSIANKFPSVFITLYNIFSMTWTESASMHINDEDSGEFFSNIMNIAIKVFSAMCFGIIACMPFVFNIMIDAKFAEAYNLIPILMIASLCNVVVGLIGAIYVAKKKTKEVAKISIYSAIINVVTHLLLIKYIGLYAAAISTFVAYFSMMIYRFKDVKKYVNINLEKGLIIKLIDMTIIVTLCYYSKNIYLNIISLIIAILYAVLINKNQIKTIMEFVNTKLRKIK